MRSIRLLAATAVILFGGACGDGGGDTGSNQDPDANFTGGPCTVAAPCAFTDASSDPEGVNTITTREWDFTGDGTPDITGNVTNPSWTFQAAGTFPVELTVTDNGGNTSSRINQVVVNPPTTGNLPPTASFTYLCNGVDCTFTNTSLDDGTFTSLWDFGDGTTSPDLNPVHSYNVTVSTPFTVTLTVTDDDGATAVATQTVTVTPGTAPTSCTTENSKTITCALGITTASRVRITLQSASCEISGNRVFIPPPEPLAQTVFSNVCFAVPVGTVYTLRDEGGAELVVAAGTQIPLRFTQGTLDAGDPPAGTPQATITGTFPTWTISIDDGGNTGGAGEPDFTDVVLFVEATP